MFHRKIFTHSKLLVIFYTLKYGEFITYIENCVNRSVLKLKLLNGFARLFN